MLVNKSTVQSKKNIENTCNTRIKYATTKPCFQKKLAQGEALAGHLLNQAVTKKIVQV